MEPVVPPPVGPATTIDDVIARMNAIEAALPVSDGVACFNRMYLEVTLGVAKQVEQKTFDDSDWVTRLDVVFANRYLLAVQAASGRPVQAPRCWSVITERRMSPYVAPLQFALAGMSSHIGYDLVDSVVRTVEEFGVEPAAVKADFTRVNDVLDQLEPKTRTSLAQGSLAQPLDSQAGALLDAVGDWGLAAARAAAFVDAEVLWDLRRHRRVSDGYQRALDSAVAFANDCLLVPAGELKAAHLLPVNAFWHGRPSGLPGLNRLRHQPIAVPTQHSDAMM